MSDQLSQITHNYREILVGLGENPEREGLLDTPKRAAKAMQYLCRGYEQSLDEIVNGALFASDNDEMVIVRNIELYSLCEHHLLPFIGILISIVIGPVTLFVWLLMMYKGFQGERYSLPFFGELAERQLR